MGCCFLLQGIFPIQGSNSHLFFFFFFKVTSQVSFLGRRILYHLLQLGSSLRWMLSIRHEMLFRRQLFLSLAITGSLFPYVPYPHHSVLSLLIYTFVQSCTAKGGGWVMDAEQHANSWIICIYSRVQHKREDSTHGHHRIANTKIRLIIFFAAKDGEALYSQQKQDWELTVAQIMNSLLPNSDLNWRE